MWIWTCFALAFVALVAHADTTEPHRLIVEQEAAYKAYEARISDTGWTAIASGKVLHSGETDERVPDLRRRLNAEGFINVPDYRAFIAEAQKIKAATPDAEKAAIVALAKAFTTRYTPGLADKVKTFQTMHGLDPDGVIGVRTLDALNESVGSKRHRIEKSRAALAALEPLPEKFVWLNIPSFTAEAWADGERQFVMKTIVGRPDRETPTFEDEIEYLVANPYWTVPYSIFVEDKLPKLRNDPGYAARNGFVIYDRSTGAAVSATSVDWTNTSAAWRYQMIQKPGANNALGELKIIFPNKDAVYMHGTPSESLFDLTERAQSSGCVRLEAPVKMGKWLAEENSDASATDIDAALASGKNARFLLKDKVPVYITYVTVTADEAGQPIFWRDIYNRVEKTEAPAQVKDTVIGGGAAVYFAEEVDFSASRCKLSDVHARN